MLTRKSFFRRIIIHMSLIIMLTFVVSAYVSYRINVGLFTEEVSKQFTKANEQAAARLDLQIRDISRISNFIVFHPYVEQVLRRSAELEVRESHTQISDQDELNQLLYQVRGDENKLYSMFLYDMKDNSFFFHVSPAASSFLDKDVYENIKWQLADSSGNLVWFPIELPSAVDSSGYRNFFIAARYMKNRSYEQYGTLVMLFDQSLFSQDLNSLVRDEQANVFLFDRQDQLVYTDLPDNEWSRIPVVADLQGQDIIEEDGTSYLYVKSRSRIMDFALVSRVSLDSLKAKSSVIFKVSASVGTVGIMLAVVMLFWSGKRLLRPLKELVQSMRRMREGNFETRVAVRTDDELAYIGQSFNSMAENLNLLIREVYERQLSEREAELTALQAQLNPHFLHNTLDTIYWELYLQGAHDTSRLVVSLSDMLRYALEPADSETTLSEELRQIRNYLTIQNTRYGDGLETIVQVEEGAGTANIPRLILQPLVENVFVHAFADKLAARVLIIKASRQSGSAIGEEQPMERSGLLIEIIDNGKGMEQAEIQRILSSASAPRSERRRAEEPVVGNKSVHIGIRSVIRRLNLIYGDPYGLKIESRAGAGTTIRLLLPLESREEVG